MKINAFKDKSKVRYSDILLIRKYKDSILFLKCFIYESRSGYYDGYQWTQNIEEAERLSTDRMNIKIIASIYKAQPVIKFGTEYEEFLV